MRKLLAIIIGSLATAVVSAEPTVTDVVAKQRYPWNGLVDITCKVTGISGTDQWKFSVAAVMPDTGNARKVSQFWVVKNGANSTDKKVMVNGSYKLLWDAQSELGVVIYSNLVIRVAVVDVHDKIQLWEGGPYWATTNIGAEEPEEYGYYFWWGDTVGYKRVNNAWVASDGSSSYFAFCEANTPTYYESIPTLQNQGWITVGAGDSNLTLSHDAAQAHWGGAWRMPTGGELCDLVSKCDWTWTTQNGVQGYLVKGKGASASIFLPCAGAGHGTSLRDAGSRGNYWSSNPDPVLSKYGFGRAYRLDFDSSDQFMWSMARYVGQPVRPIQTFRNDDIALSAARSEDSAPFLLDTLTTSTSSSIGSILVSWDASWVGGNMNATVVIADNGIEVKRTTGAGEFMHELTSFGWNELTYTTYIGGVAQSEVYTTKVYSTQCTVTFDANGGIGGWRKRLDYGTAIVAPTATREWCAFAGWSPAVAATVPASNVTYTAQWRRWGDSISASKMGGKTMKQLYPSDYATMTTVVLEEGITELPVGFFDGCNNVTSLTLPSTLLEFGIDDLPPKIRASLAYDESGFKIYGNWILDYQNRSASEVTIPEGIVGIGRGAFKEMFDLEAVTMPESLRCIAKGAFEDCSWLLNLQFMPGLRYVGPVAFGGCSSLLGASFADGVEHVGVSAFEDCWQMKSVRLPYTVTYIGDNAFKGCSAIRGVTVPTHLKTMQELFPAAYSQIETAEVAEGETTVIADMFAGCPSLRGGATQTDMSMIPNTVTNIGARAFQGCTSLTAFVVPDSVVKLGVSVFQGCTSLWNVTLSRILTEIPDYAFYGCSMLETMVVPEGVAYLGNRFFSGKYRGDNALYYLCTNAPDYDASAYAAISGDMTTYVLQDSRSWDGRQGSRVLPQSWNGYDITYWTPNRFDVTFDANGGRFDSSGGSTWSEQQITDTTYALPSTEPVRPGWAFEGWWTEQTGGAEVRYTTRVTATRTHTIYAHWRSLGNNMTVTFNSNGGTVVTPGTQNYVPGQTFGQFPVPTRRGYTFQGWWTEAAGGVRMTEATQVPAADMELFAHWKPILYYVRFHANGGTGTMSDQLFTFDVSGALKTHTFTRTGFAFTGWATTPSGQVRYAENKTVVNLEEVQDKVVNLYAVWSGIGYSVRFDSNGGTGIMDNQTIAVGETQNLWPCAFTRGGYTFAGWAVSPTDAAAKKVMYLNGAAVKDLATSNGSTVSLYAVWVTGAQTVRITFDANGGSVSPSYWDCPVETAVEAFPTPTRPGFTFAGWWTANTGGTRVESIAPVTAAQTLYAHWTENGGVVPGDNSCTVTFDVNGNGALRGEEVTRKVVKNTAIGELPIPMVPSLAGSGFGDFLGWFTGKTGGAQISSGTIVTKDITYYAHWKYFRYIVLDANGGKFSEKYDDWWPFVEDGAAIGSLPAASRSGYSFDGWYTAVSGGSKVSANTKITATASNIREPLKYYAHWSANGGSDTPPPITTCTVTFNANGGTGGKTVTLNYGAKLTAPTVTRAGYTFVGWSPAVPATVPANNATYTAQWKKNEEPEEEHELYETVDGEAPLAAASEYNGYLYDESGAMKGTIQVKVGKPNAKTGLATIKATVVVGTKKVTLKAAGKGGVQIAADGPTAIGLVGGEPCTVVLGSDGISGFYGGHEIDGARNFFTSKDKAEQGAANALLGKWLGGVSILADVGNFTVTISAKGKAKVSGTLANGKKATGNAVFLVGEEWACVPVVLPKANISFALWLPLDGGEVVVNGLGDDVAAGRGGALKAGAAFRIDEDEFFAVTGIDALPYLPDGVSVEPKGAKWVVAGGAKAGKVMYLRGTQEIDESKLGENPSGLKLTYKKADGSFKGSFKVYAEVKGKLKATTVSVSGIVLNGIGYGTATVKGKGGVAVTIE